VDDVDDVRDLGLEALGDRATVRVAGLVELLLGDPDALDEEDRRSGCSAF
jgi:hypothetical protein